MIPAVSANTASKSDQTAKHAFARSKNLLQPTKHSDGPAALVLSTRTYPYVGVGECPSATQPVWLAACQVLGPTTPSLAGRRLESCRSPQRKGWQFETLRYWPRILCRVVCGLGDTIDTCTKVWPLVLHLQKGFPVYSYTVIPCYNNNVEYTPSSNKYDANVETLFEPFSWISCVLCSLFQVLKLWCDSWGIGSLNLYLSRQRQVLDAAEKNVLEQSSSPKVHDVYGST